MSATMSTAAWVASAARSRTLPMSRPLSRAAPELEQFLSDERVTRHVKNPDAAMARVVLLAALERRGFVAPRAARPPRLRSRAAAVAADGAATIAADEEFDAIVIGAGLGGSRARRCSRRTGCASRASRRTSTRAARRTSGRRAGSGSSRGRACTRA